MSRGKTTVVRKSGGQVWEDPTLLEWDPNHFRLFVGNLGNDVTDDTLRNAFLEYPSLAKTKVVRDREGKTRGFGFVSFRDPDHFLRAWREKNGRYIGSRPVKLSRANSDVTPADVSDTTLDSKIRNSLYSRTKYHSNRIIKKKKEKRSSKSSNQAAAAAAELMASSAAPITQTGSSSAVHHKNTHPSSRMESYSKRD